MFLGTHCSAIDSRQCLCPLQGNDLKLAGSPLTPPTLYEPLLLNVNRETSFLVVFSRIYTLLCPFIHDLTIVYFSKLLDYTIKPPKILIQSVVLNLNNLYL